MGEIDIECIWKDFYQAKKDLNEEIPTNDTSTERTYISMWTCLGCGKDEKKEIEGTVDAHENAISALAKSLNEFESVFQKNKNDPVVLNAIIQKYYYNTMLLEKLKKERK